MGANEQSQSNVVKGQAGPSGHWGDKCRETQTHAGVWATARGQVGLFSPVWWHLLTSEPDLQTAATEKPGALHSSGNVSVPAHEKVPVIDFRL